MKILAHRGVSTEYPENTMAAFRVAVEQDYDGIAIETAFTKDGICVVHADETLNRTCRSVNGEELTDKVYLRDCTWEEVRQYDTGFHKSYKFKGWKMHTLAEVLRFAKENGILVKLKERCEAIENLVAESGAEVVFEGDWDEQFIETDGEIKPERRPLYLYDMHNHTHYSHDSSAKLPDLCDAAEEMGMMGIAITNHCDLNDNPEHDALTPILESLKEADIEDAKGRNLKILRGVEIGNAIWFPDQARQVIDAYEYDVVLGSVHGIRTPLTRLYRNFSEYPDEALNEYYSTYLREAYRLVTEGDLDVLTHLTYPQRYIIGQYGRNLDTESFYDQMDAIFRVMIQRGIALELNTSCVNAPYGLVMPYKEIVERYLRLGGRMLTLGSDSHWASHCAAGFKVALAMLKELGVRDLYYFEKRKPVAYTHEFLM